MTNMGLLIVPCIDGSILIQQAPVLEPAARAGYDAIVLGVLHSAGLLHEAAPYEGVWLQSLVAHLLLSGERLDTPEKLLVLPEPKPLPFHGECCDGALPRVVREPGMRGDKEGAVAQRLERALRDPFAPCVPLPREPTQRRVKKDKRRREPCALASRLQEQGHSAVAISLMPQFQAAVKKAGLKGKIPGYPYQLTERTIRQLIREYRAAQR
jgi:hypothetical protein